MQQAGGQDAYVKKLNDRRDKGETEEQIDEVESIDRGINEVAYHYRIPVAEIELWGYPFFARQVYFMLWRNYYKDVRELNIVTMIVNQGGMRSKPFKPKMPNPPFKKMVEERKIDSFEDIQRKLGKIPIARKIK